MAELREIVFNTVWVFDEGMGENRITEMSSPDLKHVAVVSHALPDRVTVCCSCDPTSVWKISRGRATGEEIQGTFNSHLSYYDRPKLTTL
jgi:hypothetical protein